MLRPAFGAELAERRRLTKYMITSTATGREEQVADHREDRLEERRQLPERRDQRRHRDPDGEHHLEQPVVRREVPVLPRHVEAEVGHRQRHGNERGERSRDEADREESRREKAERARETPDRAPDRRPECFRSASSGSRRGRSARCRCTPRAVPWRPRRSPRRRRGPRARRGSAPSSRTPANLGRPFPCSPRWPPGIRTTGTPPAAAPARRSR